MKLRIVPCLALAVASMLPGTASADDARHCKLFQDIERQTSQGIGRLIDPVTRLSAIDLQCADQVIHFRQDLIVPETALKGDWLDRQRTQWRATYCKPGSVAAAAIQAGWTVTTTITTADGARFRLTAKCSENVASDTPFDIRVAPIPPT